MCCNLWPAITCTCKTKILQLTKQWMAYSDASQLRLSPSFADQHSCTKQRTLLLWFLDHNIYSVSPHVTVAPNRRCSQSFTHHPVSPTYDIAQDTNTHCFIFAVYKTKEGVCSCILSDLFQACIN